MSFPPQAYRPSSPNLQYPSDDYTSDYYDYYDDPAAPSAHYTHGDVSDYSSFPRDHYVGTQPEGSEEVMYSGEEGMQPSSVGASTSWHVFPSPETPVFIAPEPAPDYARMSMLSETPPPSNVSVYTYLNRFANFVKKVHKMPWNAERPTADYYPEKNIQRRRKAKNLFQEDFYDRDAKEITAVSWRSRRYIEQQQRLHGGHNFGTTVAGNGKTGNVTSPYLGSLESTKSPSTPVGVIEPFPFTSAPNEDTRRNTRS